MTASSRPVRTGSRPSSLLAAALVAAGALALLATCAGPQRPADKPGDTKASAESASSAVSAASAEPPFECRWADEPITIDGKADEPAWKHAQVIDHFAMPWAGPNALPHTATRARLLWDREYLYFFADMDDSDLYADVTEHDGMTWNNDVFEMFLKPADDKPGYYEFQVSPANTTMDMFLPTRTSGGYERYKSADAFEFKTAVKLRGTLNRWQDKDTGWSVEGRLRWRDMVQTGGRPNPDEAWKFALCRYDYSVDLDGPELSSCAPLTKPSFHRYEDYATLRFVGPTKATAARPFGIDKRVAWTTSRVVGSPDPPLPFTVERAFPNLKLPAPINIEREPGTDNLLVVYQLYPWGGEGRIGRIKDAVSAGGAADAAESQPQPLLELDDIAYGVAFDPDYAHNGYLYVGSNGPTKAPPRKSRVVRYTVDRKPPFGIVPGSKKLIIEWDSDGHNGADLAFGRDGMLYVTAGDGTSDSDLNLTGQDLGTINGSVIRIDVHHPSAGMAYAVPKDNPFLDTPGARPEIWAYGLRNPWRITVDTKTGDVWVGMNGQDLWESAYLIERGANYGWSVMEGSHPFYLNRKRGPTPFSGPTVEHPHSEARSLTGGVVYYGDKLPELNGAYLYGDWSTGRIWGVRHDGKKVIWHDELAHTTIQITGFGVGPHGDLYITDHGNGGGIYRLVPTPKDAGKKSPFPTRLSETGLFTSTKDNKPDPALIAYDVNSPLWSDGAKKERFIALPGDTSIDFTTSRGWNFPEGAVLVKTFALDLKEGDPASRRRIETRLLTKQQGQWVGYSYIWNDDQTDATLVPAAGVDKAYAIQDAASPCGSRKQTWHYPSRTECMVCHSRAANFVLGPSELQMNREHDYGGVKDNQLRVLEHLGVLSVDWLAGARDKIKEEAKAEGLNDNEANDRVAKLTATRNQREAPKSLLLATPPADYARLPDPYDPKQPVEARARAYLHANCSICHVEAGGGNAMMELEYTTKRDKMNVIGATPNHEKLGLENAKLIAPGDPDHSVLLQRISLRGTGQMPPLATSRVDEVAVKVIREWIEGMKGDAAGANKSE
jgi:uncharacterized repeat protein (TIGR03806 family)